MSEPHWLVRRVPLLLAANVVPVFTLVLGYSGQGARLEALIVLAVAMGVFSFVVVEIAVRLLRRIVPLAIAALLSNVAFVVGLFVFSDENRVVLGFAVAVLVRAPDVTARLALEASRT